MLRPRPSFLSCFALAGALALYAPAPSQAEPLNFTPDWREQNFPRLTPNRYAAQGTRLDIVSDQAVSVIFTALPESRWSARDANWTWRVEQSVPPTDLRRKGGDDRNISLYFVFMDTESARRAGPNPRLRSLLGNRNARMLVYVWGGDHSRGEVLDSPYLEARGKTLILRGAGTGAHAETVDLAADYARIFGSAPAALVGVAVSADSDDTQSAIRARVSDMVLR
ncbi:DUF3047 domain-containing protein [Seohaeicola saemankumensis]|uniref:DUF3047 domain-containing protein n=1 Tax=Seohaeicola saemankumensis TaxID=481181 RepID=UPI001E451E64|nr:DUF3047 domain-containing protein [Seohaeicola saemankumensis]MCD1625465.1 DUF3047 domain-containing protein [Seohaeicola saemankumensis]